MKWSTERQVTLGFGFALLALTVVGLGSYVSLVRLISTHEWVAHTLEVLDDTEEVRAAVLQAQTARRGYIISGEQQHLESFLDASERLKQKLLVLQRSTLDNPRAQQLTAKLDSLVARKLAEQRKSIEMRRSQGLDLAVQAALTAKGEVVSDDIRQVIDAIKNEETRALRQARDRAAASAWRAISIILAAGLFAPAVVVGAVFTIRRGLRRRRKAEEALRRAHDELDSRVRERTAELADANEKLVAEIAAHRRSEAQLRTIVENVTEGLAVSDLDGQLLHFNRAALDIHGFASPHEARRHLNQFADTFELFDMDGARWPIEQWPLARILRGEELRDLEARVRHIHDGWERVFTYGGTLVRDPGGEPMLAIVTIRDITERKRAEDEILAHNKELARVNEELRMEVTQRQRAEQELQAKTEEMRAMSQQLWQAAKLATMGELAASIAHELNNPLSTISLRVEALLTGLPPDDPKRRALEVVELESERMAALVTNLLQFSRRSTQQISTVDLRAELAATLELIHYRLRNHRVSVVSDLAPDLPTVQADRQQLRQLFLNLFNNAIDAMPGGGTLTMRARISDFQLPIGGRRGQSATGDWQSEMSSTGNELSPSGSAETSPPARY
jgi:C4-dicarboxylate-specific signal transduction histidine kinase